MLQYPPRLCHTPSLTWCLISSEGPQHDIMGSPLGDASSEVDKLDSVQQAMLLDGICLGRIIPDRVRRAHPGADLLGPLEDLVLRGLARRGRRGTVLTGRGMVLREELFRRAGRGLPDWIR